MNRWLTMLVLVVAGCAPRAVKAKTYSVDISYQPPGYEVSNAATEGYLNGTAIVGDIKNTLGDKNTVYVVFDCLDAQNRKVDEVADKMTGLASGQTWRFKAFCKNPDAVKFKLTGITTDN